MSNPRFTAISDCAHLSNLQTRQIMKKICMLLTVILISVAAVKGQAPGPFYRQFAFNPYLFNPGFVGISNNIEASMVYRQQWGNFKDAPVTAGASIQIPTTERVALGFNIFTDKQVLLQNSNFMATFGYVVPIAKNQSLRFGLSGGVGLNKLDLTADELNTQDPVITKAAGTNYYIDGNFGVVYTYEGLKLGFALTDLFKSNTFAQDGFNKFKMSNLRNRLFSASYRFNVGVMQNIALEPYMLYRQTTDGQQDYLEVATIAYFKENLWTGVSYNQNKGIGLIFGMNVKEKFRFSYSYELPSFGSAKALGGAHELHIGVRLASKRSKAYAKNTQEGRSLANEMKPSVRKDPRGTVLEDTKTQEDTEVHQPRLLEGDQIVKKQQEEPVTIAKEPATIAKAPVPAAKKPEVKSTAKKAPATKVRENFTMSHGRSYVVVGVFKLMNGSMKYVKSVREKGYQANVALNPKNNMYYVYIYSSTKVQDAKKYRNDYKWKNFFKEAWVFTMD